MRFYKYILLLVMCVLAFADANAQSDRQFIRNGNRLYRQQNYAKAEIGPEQESVEPTGSVQLGHGIAHAAEGQRGRGTIAKRGKV